ncbi:MAG: hypothetical protein AAF851_11620 [Myxococcota bacterium]
MTWVWAMVASASLWGDALRASGVPAEEVRAQSQALVRRTRFVEPLRALPEADRGAALLAALHEELLQSYSARATSLTNILQEGRYNCVSSAVLYAELAHELDLDVRAEIHTTHARVQVRIGDEWRIVETTTARGFDPDAEQRRRVAARLGGALASGRGRVMPRRALVAAIYVNRGIFAQELGRTREAEALYARGVSYADDPSFRRSLEEQRAGLGLQLAFEHFEEGQWRASFDTLLRIYALGRLDPELARLRDRNFEAYAQRWFREAPTRALSSVGPELAKLPAVARDLALGHAEMELGQRAAEDARWKEAEAHFEQAARLLSRGSPVVARVAARNAESMARNRSTQARADDERRARRLASEGRLEEALSLVPARPWLYMVAGLGHLEREEPDPALRVFARCLEVFAAYEGCQKNLLVALQRSILRRSDCRSREPLLARFEAEAPQSVFPKEARLRCWTERARSAFRAGDTEQAFEALFEVAGLGDPGVRRNLEAIFARWQKSSACGQVRSAAERLRAEHGWSPGLGVCAR